ncbi:MAG: hypothetical protein ACRCYE_13080 [Sarcina sp.]
MKKILVATLLLTTFTSLFAIPVYADNTQNSEYTSICESAGECIDPQSGEKVVIPWPIISAIGKFLGIDAIHSNHTITNWIKADSSGYYRYVTAFNDGGKHCYNNCPAHRSINPYNYGFKNSYKCHQ